MKQISLFFFIFVLTLFNLKAQEKYKKIDHYREIIDFEYRVSEETLKDALERTGYTEREYEQGYIYTYLSEDGYISIGDHDRVIVAIYDKDEQWLETQLYVYQFTDEKKYQKSKEYGKIKKALEQSAYELVDSDSIVEDYRIIINKNTKWYEIEVQNTKMNGKVEYGNVLLDEKFNFIRYEKYK